MPRVHFESTDHSRRNAHLATPPAQPVASPANEADKTLRPPERIIATSPPGNTANRVNNIPPEEQAEVAALLDTLMAALDDLSSKNASQLNASGHATAPDNNLASSPAVRPAETANPVAHNSHRPATDNASPGKQNKMSEAISNCFSGRAGTIAGALVFGVVVVSAIALMSAFPPILLFGAVFGIAVAAEMLKPVREFQADLRSEHEEEKFNSNREFQADLRNQQEEDDFNHNWQNRLEQEEELDEDLQFPPAPTAPLQPQTPTFITSAQPANIIHPPGAPTRLAQRPLS